MSPVPKLICITPLGMAIAGTAPVAFLFGIILSQTLPKLVDPCVIFNFNGGAGGGQRTAAGAYELHIQFIVQSLQGGESVSPDLNYQADSKSSMI